METKDFQIMIVKNTRYLVNFLQIPIPLDDLKELKIIVDNLLNNVSEEDYKNIQNYFTDKYVPNFKCFESDIESPEYLTRKEKELKEEIEKIDFLLTKPIITEKEIESFISEMKTYKLDYKNLVNVSYPVLCALKKDNKIIKILKCYKNLEQTLENRKIKIDFDSFSFVTVPDEYLDQIYEYFFVTRNPKFDTNVNLQLKGGVLITPEKVRKKIRYKADYQISAKKIVDIALINGLDVYNAVNGQIYLNCREIFDHVYKFLQNKNTKRLIIKNNRF